MTTIFKKGLKRLLYLVTSQYRKLLFTVSGIKERITVSDSSTVPCLSYYVLTLCTLTMLSMLVRCSLTSLYNSQDTREWQKRKNPNGGIVKMLRAYCKKIIFLTSDSSAKTSNDGSKTSNLM